MRLDCLSDIAMIDWPYRVELFACPLRHLVSGHLAVDLREHLEHVERAESFDHVLAHPHTLKGNRPFTSNRHLIDAFRPHSRRVIVQRTGRSLERSLERIRDHHRRKYLFLGENVHHLLNKIQLPRLWQNGKARTVAPACRLNERVVTQIAPDGEREAIVAALLDHLLTLHLDVSGQILLPSLYVVSIRAHFARLARLDNVDKFETL